MRVIKIHPEYFNWMAFNAENDVEEVLKTVEELLPELADGDRLIIEIGEMSEEEFSNLPEFPGW